MLPTYHRPGDRGVLRLLIDFFSTSTSSALSTVHAIFSIFLLAAPMSAFVFCFINILNIGGSRADLQLAVMVLSLLVLQMQPSRAARALSTVRCGNVMHRVPDLS